MQGTLSVCWHITPLDYPRIWRHCPKCRGHAAFACSGKFRTNAQKQRLDIWLIYRCAACDTTWNYPLLERRAVRDVDPLLLAAIAHNSADVARRFAFDVVRLRRFADRVEGGSALRVEKRAGIEAGSTPDKVCIAVSLPEPCAVRLDRLLAGELGVSRAALRQFELLGALQVTPAVRAALRRPIIDGQRICIDLRRLGGRAEAACAILHGVC